MRRRYLLFVLVSLFFSTSAFVACSGEQDTLRNDKLSPAQQNLIGQGINFNASIADSYVTRATYRHDGTFNEEDIMTIYRQYSHDAGITFDVSTESYRVYELKTKYATGTTFALETDWKPKEGEMGYNPDTDEYPSDKRGLFTQTEADSLTWENGNTVRFRSWSRSNLDNCITRSVSDRNRYYPDFCVSEWVTVSGPTMDVPLTLKHQGCRIGFIAKSGNELQKAEICTDWHDYKRIDNADTNEHDTFETESGKTDEEAQAECNAVLAVYNQMCMPAGVDVETSTLNTMTKELYNTDIGEGSSKKTRLGEIHSLTTNDGIVKINTKTPAEIESDVQRPVFCANDGRQYMVTIPYDMSNDAKSGEGLKLPACTRFKVWLYDVNDGDGTNTGEGYYEANYHILTLGDLKDKKGEKYMYPDGLELVPGNSYMFSVGYQYDHFTVTPVDNFSWAQQDAENGYGTNERHNVGASPKYKWWKDAIKEAIKKTKSGEKYDPQFHIKTQEEFLEFINLVNGTATDKMSGLTQLLDPTKTYDAENPATNGDYRWYRSADFDEDGKLKEGADSVTHAVAEAEGYIFYEHYHPANADQAAYSIEDYLRGPYSFHDEALNRHFTVYLDNDLDFFDWKLTPIGNELVALGTSGSHPFRGVFEGQMHTLKNVFFDGGYMFKHCFGTAIRNLQIETVHDFKLLHTAEAANEKTDYAAYIVGISIKAPSSGNPIATKLIGSSYVVGCIYQGRATGAMVGTANNLNMFANMMVAEGIPSGNGALLGSYASGSTEFFKPQSGKKLTWGRFMVNYFDTELSPGTKAVGGKDYTYKPQEYIRGAASHILKAKDDNLLSDEVPWDELVKRNNPLLLEGYYGLAPWKAMNYALWIYNSANVQEHHDCEGHFVNDNTGYAHSYPKLVSGAPTEDEVKDWNVLEQNN